MLAAWEAVGGKRPSAEIPRSITLLEMYQRMEGRRIDLIGDLGIAEQWKRSMKPENQEWLSGALAMVSSKEVRQLVYSAKPGGDGVHGMVAGTTGSGKSELLQTLIAGLAIKYDPRIVNFVLVDYKGGATIEPFRGLPHVVDMATNLEGNAVDRIFVAIKAEMDRRSEILAKAGVADLIDYRKKVIPTLKPDSPFPDTFPHLFVIVDEFAEMIQANPDYKLQFEQITRLGRAFGVTLILATQRPSGAVTDQMKANMKFRLCLRVETTDDSREMLGRNDAATLPGIPGRGYLQVGGGPVSEFQAAYSGASYDISRPDPAYSADEILEVLQKQNDPPRSFLGWLVGALAAENRSGRGSRAQFKPWPNPLPTVLPLNAPIDATYIFKDAGVPSVVLAPAVQQWMEAPDSNAALGAVRLEEGADAGRGDDGGDRQPLPGPAAPAHRRCRRRSAAGPRRLRPRQDDLPEVARRLSGGAALAGRTALLRLGFRSRRPQGPSDAAACRRRRRGQRAGSSRAPVPHDPQHDRRSPAQAPGLRLARRLQRRQSPEPPSRPCSWSSITSPSSGKRTRTT